MGREPGYIALFKSGELKRRADFLVAKLAACDICPLNCRVNRLEDRRGFCRSGRQPIISSCCAHQGEEPALSGTRGSGTIFFGNCNMRCVYCQNYQISQEPAQQQKNEADSHILADTDALPSKRASLPQHQPGLTVPFRTPDCGGAAGSGPSGLASPSGLQYRRLRFSGDD